MSKTGHSLLRRSHSVQSWSFQSLTMGKFVCIFYCNKHLGLRQNETIVSFCQIIGGLFAQRFSRDSGIYVLWSFHCFQKFFRAPSIIVTHCPHIFHARHAQIYRVSKNTDAFHVQVNRELIAEIRQFPCVQPTERG